MKKSIFVFSLLVAVMTVGVFFYKKNDFKQNVDFARLDEKELFSYKSQYVGDVSNVSGLLDQLAFGTYRRSVSLQTVKEPYGMTVHYDMENTEMGLKKIEKLLYDNAVILFVLIENLDRITFDMNVDAKHVSYSFEREQVQKQMDEHLSVYAKDIDRFRSLLYALKGVGDVEKAVSEAIKEHGKTYGKGEYITEGHIILGAEQKGNEVKAYTIASVGVFEFQDGIFAIVSGSGAIPTVMTFSIDEHGQYKIIAYEEPLDGDAYAKSVKRMFPKKYYSQVLYAEKYYDELAEQQERQAREYLKQIGRDAKVSTWHVEKQPLNISVEAMNHFLTMLGSDPFLSKCPDWLGTREVIEQGIRYVYETSQSKTNDERDVIVLKKMEEDGTIIDMRQYVIGENKLKLIK
ncbi:DUF4825 domain-containing protein [Anoxybacillus flavithermus]|uniref:Uncharacterized conserved two domain fusion protein n=1 Tax=Anoxybacillus flavithermus (strain DSM 21510 / WK1) TaxID=491915 RepID=B7GFZ6_ANOFW|nr:DUF4825 domain-containing protein [Anoxybacillus flavithermus]ACJ32675.1 Uncharacterized conserved two domain fusion protein [Anoxybacillus flavithermus WK1]